MTTHPRDVVAVPDQTLVLNEPALKQVAVLFNRIAFPGLSKFRSLPETHLNFAEHVLRVAESGILFEPEIQQSQDQGFKNQMRQDIDELFKPSGVTAEDLFAARTDEKKALEVKEKTRSRDFISENDPYAVFSAMQRMVANMTRLGAVQLRNFNNLDAHAILSSEFSSLDQDDQAPNRRDVLKILINGLPLPDKDVSWEQIIEYRSDPNSLNRFLDLRNWISDTAQGKLTSLEAEQRLEPVLKRFHKQAEIHQLRQ